MWFRLSVGGGSSGADSTDEANAPTAAASNSSPVANEPSKFEKFRRASFRRKSLTGQTPTRKRSKSPHNTILAQQMSSSLEEADEDEERNRAIKTKESSMATIGENHVNTKKTDDSSSDTASRKLFKSELDIVLSAQQRQSDPKAKVMTTTTTCTSSAKKAALKPIKTDPPKRKFYKNFTTSSSTRRQKSLEEEEEASDVAAIMASATVAAPTIFHKKITDDDESEDDDEDEDDEDDDDDDDDSESESSDDNAKADNLPLQRGKEKRILLTDPKFKHNRIEKSSSKTKLNNDLEKRESLKRSRSARKIAAAPSAVNHHNDDTSSPSKKKDKKEKSRAHTNLNLQTLVKFVMNNKKFLNTDDFTLMRRKSISEAASSIITVAATCKPLPIALKYSADGVVADAPKVNDAKGERNVVLVKKQSLQTSFCDRLNNNKSIDECDDKETKKDVKFGGKEVLRSIGSAGSGGKKSPSKVKRNSSSSSKSSGNFEDEAFYSCDEQENERLKAEAMAASGTTNADEVVKRKASSPSLTSRVAAKINEKTNNFKNRKAAAVAASKTAKTKRKQLADSGGGNQQRAEFYKQISVERLHTPSIVRQPSDRRPDAVNISLRSNGNAAHNTSDLLQSSYHASSPAAAESSGSGGGDTPLATTPGGAGGAGGAAAGGAAAAAMGGLSGSDMNAQDAVAESKDARRERLHQQNKSAPVSVNRSESYKERLSQKRNRNSRRKTSDPSLTSRPNDEQTDLGLSNSNYTASSNSSLSSGGGSESPSTSMEQVGGGAAAAATASGLTQHSHSMHAHHSAPPHHTHQHSHQDSFHGSIGGGSNNASFWGGSIGGPGGTTIGQLTNQWNFYSDEEDDLMNETDWSSNIAAEILSALTDAEKKRQEIINEIYQTERNHVRTLKLLERLFFGPLQESGVLSPDHLSLLFPPALLSLRELHSAFEQKLKQRRVEHNHIVNHIGDLLVSMFDGLSGDELCDFAAQFCARQQIALEALKEKRRKDEQLQKLLTKAESHKACRRLQLKDLLPTVLQRLTKYPLLFENLYKVTIRVVPENTTEAEAIQKALESSKKILVDVNQAVKTAEDAHKLQNIQRKLDKSTFDKDEFRNLDLTQYRLIHDGSLTMKKNPSIQLHGLLFENMIVLLTKQDDKYSLKYLHAARNTEVNNKPVSPIMSIDSETLVRQEAADKNSFFLIKTKTSQMLELRAPSSSECKTWFKHISDAAEQYKPRSKNANHEPVDDPAIATLPHSNTKESLELTPERPPPLSATATVTTTPLAPMMPIATATSVPYAAHNNNNNESGVQMRNGRRESTPTSAGDSNSSISMSAGSGAYHKQRFSQNELTPASASVSRTMSTRSCGEPNNNDNNNSYGSGEGGLGISNLNGVTLRHTQSARQANGSDDTSNATSLAGGSSSIGGPSNRNSASIVYSNNSNNTRTLMQSSPPLVEPTAIQISISPAHKAEAVHTPAERLRRLDASIRDGLLEKQKIICDMFRLPVEHFNEIVDIAAMPEAPKDSADIALAAYAQVQSLTEVLNDYMHVTPEQEISAVSTAVCDHCHEKQRHQRPSTPQTASSTPSSATTSSTATQIAADTPPPLPPPNKQPPLKKKQQQSAQQQTPAPSVTKLQTPAAALETADVDILEDDDGYCEIDELRLPALPPTLLSSAIGKSTAVAAAPKSTSPPPPLPPPAGSFKVPPPPPPPPSSSTSTSSSSPSISTTTAAATTTASSAGTSATVPPAELVKRQSTISADSIPEESADEVTQALNDTTIATATTTITINSSSSPTAPTATAVAATNDGSRSCSIESETKDQQANANDEKDSKYGDVEKKESQESEDTKKTTTDDAAAASNADDKTEHNDGNDDGKKSADSDNIDANAADTSVSVSTSTSTAEPQQKKLTKTGDDDATATSASATTRAELKSSSEHIEINDAYDTVASLNKSNTTLSISMVDGTTQTLPMAMFNTIINAATATAIAGTNSGAAAITNGSHHQLILCGPNRIQHANSLEPSVPCHALNSIVSALNAQISLLLPKINERDMERERLRKENQHLRELLNAMHERQRVEAKLETPNDTTTSVDAIDEIDSGSQAMPSSTATTTTAEAYETPTTTLTADAEN